MTTETIAVSSARFVSSSDDNCPISSEHTAAYFVFVLLSSGLRAVNKKAVGSLLHITFGNDLSESFVFFVEKPVDRYAAHVYIRQPSVVHQLLGERVTSVNNKGINPITTLF